MNLETGIGVPSGVDRRKTAPTLERIKSLTELLGSPQLEFPAVHLTGTNGKTSATRMTAALLETVGLATGSYTSPDLSRVNERMAIHGEPISDVELAAALSRVATVEEFIKDRPSYFEILTAAAFDWFAQEAVDVAVVEVGVGGTWDATTIVQAPVAVVTNVSIDHVEYLGTTLPEIATEKAGIVEEGSTLVLGETDPELVEIFAARAGQREILLRDRDFSIRSQRLAHGGRQIDLVTPTGPYDEVYLPLHGAHQADNAVIALTAAESFIGERLSHELVSEAFAALTSPGRLEVVGRQPLLLLDGAHNVAGARALLQRARRGVRAGAAHVGRRTAAREGAARDARGTRCHLRGASGVHARTEPPSAGPDGGGERGDGPRLRRRRDRHGRLGARGRRARTPRDAGRRPGDRHWLALHRRCRPLGPGAVNGGVRPLVTLNGPFPGPRRRTGILLGS